MAECECWRIGCSKTPVVFVRALAQDVEIALCAEHGVTVMERVGKL